MIDQPSPASVVWRWIRLKMPGHFGLKFFVHTLEYELKILTRTDLGLVKSRSDAPDDGSWANGRFAAPKNPRRLTPFWYFLSVVLLTGCASLPMELDQYSDTPQEDSLPQEPQSQQSQLLSLIWMPSPKKTGQEILQTIGPLARRYDDWTIVMALAITTIETLSPEEKNQFLQLEEQGRISLAVQLYGGLPLGMLTTTKKFLENNLSTPVPPRTPQRILRDFEIPRLLLMTEEAWTQAFSETNKKPGLILPMGNWPAATPKFKALKHFSWVIAASTNGLMGSDGVNAWYHALTITPTSPPQSHWQGILVIDETNETEPTNTSQLLAEALEQHDDGDTPWKLTPIDSWLSLPMTGPLYPDENPCSKSCSTWVQNNNFAALWGTPAQERYWTMIAQWRKDILQYQNSGKANVSALDQIWNEFYLWLNIRVPSSLATNENMPESILSLEPEFIKTLRTSYQKMFSVLGKYPLTGESLNSPANDLTAQTDVAGTLTQLRFVDQFDEKQPNADSPNIDQFLISWNDQEISFEIKFLNPLTAPPSTELYIDLNNQSFAGQSDNFDGTLHAAAKDHWEYAVKGDSNARLTLFRYNPQGAPRQRDSLENAVKWQEGTLTAHFNRSWIAGKTPNKWGWALCVQNEASSQTRDCLSLSATPPDVLPFARP